MEKQTEIQLDSKQTKNRKLSMILASVVVFMFAFAFALSPLYQLICSVTGINSIANNSARVTEQQLASITLDKERTVIVEFDVTLSENIPFTVSPTIKSIEVHPGELITTSYRVTNVSPQTIVTQAVPGITPWQATAYFHKTECFCFTQQTLTGNEEVEMGLKFMVDADLPKDIKVLTLSYTFMNTKHLNIVSQANN